MKLRVDRLRQPHANECDSERCSVCGGLRISCECPGHFPQRATWTGQWSIIEPNSENREVDT
jgi:hypothetical protein